MGTGLKGDFLGFSFGGIHSSELGITRVSDGSRYSTDLLPTIKDSTVEVPGGNGLYYFGQTYTQRTFNISVAYDNLTEEQIRNIRKLFGSNEQQKLIFDEAPYKYYWAKSTGTSSLKFVCFSDQENSNTKIIHNHNLGSEVQAQSYETGRIYKGEGTLSFICYDPFGYSVSRWLAGIDEEYRYDVNSWSAASGLQTEYDEEDKVVEKPWAYWDKNATLIKAGPSETKTIEVNNNGDLETDWIITMTVNGTDLTESISAEIKLNSQDDKLIDISGLKLKSPDKKIMINSKLNLIVGAYDDGNTNYFSGNIYNEYMTGSFFKLPVGENLLSITAKENTSIGVISFNYKYF